MSGSDEKHSSDSNNCHSGEEDPLEELMATMAGLSVNGQSCPPVGGTSKKDPQNCRKVTLSMPLGADSEESIDAQNCHSGEEDPLEELMATMAGLSVNGQSCPPVGGTSKKDPQNCRKVTLSMPLGADSAESIDAKNCQSGEEDPLEELTAAMAGLSVNGQSCPPVGGTSKKDPKNCRKVTLSMLLGADSEESIGAQVKPLKRQWYNVTSEDNVRSRRRPGCTSPYSSRIKKKVLGKNKGERTTMYFIYNRKKPEPTIPQEQESMKYEMTEMREETEKAKPRQGGILHRSENNCCPVLLPPSPPEPQSLRDLQMDDIRAVGQNCPASYLYWMWGLIPSLPFSTVV